MKGPSSNTSSITRRGTKIAGWLLPLIALSSACSSTVVGTGQESSGNPSAPDDPTDPDHSSSCGLSPNVVFLANRAGAMSEVRGFNERVQAAIDSGEYSTWDCPDDEQDWRWNVLRNVLLHPDDGVVQAREEAVRFGLAHYAPEDGNVTDGTCPEVTQTELSFGARGEMLNLMGCGDLRGNTPTREALTEAAEALAQEEVDGPKVVVLIMAGGPDSCECPDWTKGGASTNNDTPDACLDDGTEIGEERELNYQTSPSGDGSFLRPSRYEQELLVLEAERIREELGVFVEVVNLSSPNQTDVRDNADDIALAGDSKVGSSIEAFDPVSLRAGLEQILDSYLECD